MLQSLLLFFALAMEAMDPLNGRMLQSLLLFFALAMEAMDPLNGRIDDGSDSRNIDNSVNSDSSSGSTRNSNTSKAVSHWFEECISIG